MRIKYLAFLGTALVWSSNALHCQVDPLIPFPLETAYEQAELKKELIFVAFLGNGWSVASEKFEKDVLKNPEFVAFAEANLVMYPVVARRNPKLSKTETALLQSLVVYFDIKSYPTIILLGPDGKEILRHGYKEVSAKEYINSLSALIPNAVPAEKKTSD